MTGLFNMTGGQSGGWVHSDNWSMDYLDDPCDAGQPWYGVTCNSSGTAIIGIALPNNTLVGDISALILSDWGALETFDVHGNPGIGGYSMPLLDAAMLTYVDVSGCGLTGAISDLSDVPNLVTFIGNDNAFTTAPSSLAGLANLEVFALDNNQLTGSIPDINSMPSLKTFQVGGNQFSYAPTYVQDLPSLEEYKIDNNSLASLPSAFNNLPSLKRLIMFENAPVGVPLSPIPSGIASLPSLEQFLASHANLNGTIPTLLGLSNLQVFSISDNAVTGAIPALPPSTKSFLADNNQLSGALPVLSSLTNLDTFSVSNNAVTGPLPALPTGLTIFVADNNQLSGVIPSLSGLASLIKFRVGGNAGLTGLPPDLYPGAPLAAGGSSLCPTDLSPTPGAGWNATWDAATGSSPWWTGCTGTPQVFVTFLDRQVLEDLYNSTSGPNWFVNSGWLGPIGTECTWYGVHCNGQGTRVTGLSLAANNLQGTLPGSLSTLPELNYLQISDNGLYGALPSIPPSLLNASVCPNDFNPVASPAWDAATGVSPWYQGCVSVPSGIPPSERSALIDFYNATQGPGWTDDTGWLGDAGTECTWFGVVCDSDGAHVTALQLPGNHLVGTIPASLAQLSALQALVVNANQLSGAIPDGSGFQQLVPGASSLCPNSFAISTSQAWNLATGESPWYLNCVQISLGDGFDPGTDDAVLALATDSQGRVVVGGRFSMLAGEARPYLGRLLPNGQLDPEFPSIEINGAVQAVLIQADGGILLGGQFSTVDGQQRNHLARLHPDGSLDSGFTPDFDGDVNALLLQDDGQIVVGGAFTHVNGNAQRGLARVHDDGSIYPGFDASTDGSVLALALHHGRQIVVGGAFTSVNSQSRSNLALIDLSGDLVPEFDTAANAAVMSLVVQPDGKIVVGGVFSEIAGAAQAHLARLNESGTIDTSFAAQADGAVRSLVQQADGALILGGDFTAIDGHLRAHVARVGLDGHLDMSFNSAASASVMALAVQSDARVLVGGEFLSVGGLDRSHLARVYPDGRVDADLETQFDGSINSLSVRADGGIVVGGSFAHVDAHGRNHWAVLDSGGSLDASRDADLASDGVVSASLQLPNGDSLVAHSSVQDNATVYAVSKVCSGACATGFSATTNGPVEAMALRADGKVLLAGSFSEVNGQPRRHVARLNGDGSLDAAFAVDVDAPVHSLAILPGGGLVIGGGFGQVDGAARRWLAKLTPNGALVESFDAGFSGSGDEEVRTVVRQANGMLLVGGKFGFVANTPRRSLVRLTSNGRLDPAFAPQVNLGSQPGWVTSLALDASGQVVVAGIFDSIGGASRVNLARLMSDGSVDSRVQFDAAGASTINALAVQADGKVLIGGEFDQMAGESRGNVARVAMPEPALYRLEFNPTAEDTGSVTWQRTGSAAALPRAPMLQISANGSAFVPVGAMAYGADGWTREGVKVPINHNFWLRVEGSVSSGLHNGSSGMASRTRLAYVRRDRLAIDDVAPAAFVGQSGWRFTVRNQSPHRTRQIVLLVDAQQVDQLAFVPTCSTDSAGGTGTIRCERPADVGVSCESSGASERRCSVVSLVPAEGRSFFLAPKPGAEGPFSVRLVVDGMANSQYTFTP
ncbi:MAG TPA: hypothetical protein VFN29_04155 [Chiayiivirga sp.]|nr:hypothetical protein [Chiayiivirga sp.]